MEHKKQYHCRSLEIKEKTLIVEGPLTHDQFILHEFHDGLNAFRKPREQFEALAEITELSEGRVLIVRDSNCIVGYVTFLYPDPLERWSQGKMENLLELGSIEITPPYRGLSLSEHLLEVAMEDETMEDYIVMSTEYYWHWDLKGSGLDVWQYRDMMEKVMAAGGLKWLATDDEEISAHPANCLMVRIGKNVDLASIQQFDRLRFQYRFMY